MARDGVQRAGVRWMIIIVSAVAVVFGPSLIVINQQDLLRAATQTSAPVNDQSPEDSTTDQATIDGTDARATSGVSAMTDAGVDAASALPTNVLWEADPGLGTRVFEGLEQLPGAITVAEDPQGRFGPSFRYETWDNPDGQKERCESRGLRRPDGSVVNLGSAEEGKTYFLGWRALWDPMPTAQDRWITLFELHVSGVAAGGLNVGPFVLRTLGDGRLYFQLISPDGTYRHIWSAQLPQNQWSRFVVGFQLSRDSSGGWVEFWYNGVQQKLSNGTTSYPATTLWGTHVNPKFGVYRSGANSGHAVAYINRARLGTTYASVAP
jgi:hypothetical protein